MVGGGKVDLVKRIFVVASAAVVLALVTMGSVIGSVAAADSDRNRPKLLAPKVPAQIVAAVHAAETQSRESEHGTLRGCLEWMQCAIADAFPSAAAELNFSAGEFALKPKTVGALHDFARANGYLDSSVSKDDFTCAMADAANDPKCASEQVALLLDYYKSVHPNLSAMSWEQIAMDQCATAKLYSAYAGGDQDLELWQSTNEPGPVAKTRLDYDPTTARYRTLDTITIAA